jgi:polar amino acid transport system permease protein
VSDAPPVDSVRPAGPDAPAHLRPPATGRALAAAVAGTALAVAATWGVVLTVLDAQPDIAPAITALLVAFAALGTAFVVRPLPRALQLSSEAGRACEAGDIVSARRSAALSRQASWMTLALCGALVIVLLGIVFLATNDAAVQKTFVQWELIELSFGEILKAFGQNAMIALIAEALVLVWALLVALARLAPGRSGKPLRVLAIIYIDAFRGLPAIIVIYLVGFGLPLTEVPGLSDLGGMWYAVIALTLTYGAYVAEVYRSGIESVHWSQAAAARSLGFSYLQSLRHVVVPQAVRRVIPPLLNDFIALQKDTAVVGIIGTLEAFNQSRIFASNHFNLSSVTVVAIIFLLITIPQARLVDRLLARDGRTRGGA